MTTNEKRKWAIFFGIFTLLALIMFERAQLSEERRIQTSGAALVQFSQSLRADSQRAALLSIALTEDWDELNAQRFRAELREVVEQMKNSLGVLTKGEPQMRIRAWHSRELDRLLHGDNSGLGKRLESFISAGHKLAQKGQGKSIPLADPDLQMLVLESTSLYADLERLSKQYLREIDKGLQTTTRLESLTALTLLLSFFGLAFFGVIHSRHVWVPYLRRLKLRRT